MVKRGDVFLVNFDPSVGVEIKKTRPALIIQNDIGNKYGAVTIVAAITSRVGDEQLYPTEVLISASEGGLASDSIILLNQLRTIDKQRLGKKIGTITQDSLVRVSTALEISLGLVDVI